jgi:uncharacterized membrane protein
MSTSTIQNKTIQLAKILPYILIIAGVIGLVASFVITVEKLQLLQNPAYHPSCSLNPIVSCGPIMESKQASAFGFPNPFIGLIGFGLVINVGVSMLAGGKFKNWYWRLFNIGSLLGVLFVHWLIFEALFEIKALCIYCIIVWLATIAIFLYTTLYNLQEKHITLPVKFEKTKQFLIRQSLNILLLWYLAIALLIIIQFWYYWKTIF